MTSLNIYLKIGFVSIALLFLPCTVYSQSPMLMRSALGSGGASVSVHPDGSKISFPQSIGQFGITGVFTDNNIEIRQGFIQPVLIVKAVSKTEIIKIIVYPNPFSTEVNLKISEEIAGNIELKIIDIAGKTVYAGTIPAAATFKIDLSFLYSGMYMLSVKGNNFLVNYKIIKN